MGCTIPHNKKNASAVKFEHLNGILTQGLPMTTELIVDAIAALRFAIQGWYVESIPGEDNRFIVRPGIVVTRFRIVNKNNSDLT